MTAPARPGDRHVPRVLATAALPCAVVSALAVGGAVAAAPSSVRVPLGLGASAAAVLPCVAVTVAVHAVHRERATRRLLDSARADAAGPAQDRARPAERERQERERLPEGRERAIAGQTRRATSLAGLLADRLPDIGLAVPAGPLIRRPSPWLRGLTELPVRFTPTTALGGTSA